MIVDPAFQLLSKIVGHPAVRQLDLAMNLLALDIYLLRKIRRVG
jgi:hypothetical protein